MMDGQIDGSITRLKDGQMNGMIERSDGQMNGSITRLIEGWIDGAQ